MTPSIVITGASRGLGAALATRFAAPGTRIGLIGRDSTALAAIAAACQARGATTRIAIQDVRDGPAMQALLEAWDDAHPITLAIANAGITGGRQADGAMDGNIGARRLMDVNTLGAMHLAEPLIPRMTVRRAGQIAFIASLAGLIGMPDHPVYSASKAAIITYADALRAALRPTNIAISVILPGYFASDLDAHWTGPKPLSLPLNTMADRIAAAIRARRPRTMIPRRLGLLLQLLALLPSPLADRLIRLQRLTYHP